MNRKSFVAIILASLVALTLAGIAGFAIAASSSETKVETETVIPVPGPTPDVTIGETGPGTVADQGQADETPPGVSQADVDSIEESSPAGIGAPQPLGGPELLSCESKPVVNFSERAPGSKVSQIVIHYTVSRPGTIDAIRNLFNTPSFEASSHDLLEPDGKCYHLVDYAKKAWTQGAFNSVSDSIEIVCCTSDPSREWWLAQPIISKGLLASWIVDRLRARGLPARLVDPVECTPQAGFTDHLRLECGNTHTDVGAHFPWDKVSAQVKTLMNVGKVVTVWRASSGGKVLAERKTTDAGSGYDRLLSWMKGKGEAAVRKAEAANGTVTIRKVRVST